MVGQGLTVRVAIAHHWFVTRGGGERVAECIASLFPQAEIFTLLERPEGLPRALAGRRRHTSFLQGIPFGTRYHRHLMPFYPAAAESLDMRGFDLVISSDSGPIKGIQVDKSATHLCYCHSPMRYLYDGFSAYRSQMRGIVRGLFSLSAGSVRRWDTLAAQRVDGFIANSHYVARRIERNYGRTSEVIHPPIDLSLARTADRPGEHYLCAGRLVGYKRTELMIEACQRLGRRLRIAGDGPELARLQQLAGPETEFLGPLSDDALWRQYSECRALLFAADEDFGMVPLEAQACGRPVIAYGAGGSLETVRGMGARPTGVYFERQTVESVMEGILDFECHEDRFHPLRARAWAEQFGTRHFLDRMRAFILDRVPGAETAMLPTE
jgi:glycosyltransferase involved in cell wall biosynthesis